MLVNIMRVHVGGAKTCSTSTVALAVKQQVNSREFTQKRYKHSSISSKFRYILCDNQQLATACVGCIHTILKYEACC